MARRAYNFRSNGDDDDSSSTPYRSSSSSSASRGAASSTSLRAQLTSIADTFEQRRASEQRLLNTRISNLTSEKMSLQDERDTAVKDLATEKAKVEERDETIADLTKDVENLREASKVTFHTSSSL